MQKKCAPQTRGEDLWRISPNKKNQNTGGDVDDQKRHTYKKMKDMKHNFNLGYEGQQWGYNKKKLKL